MNFTTKHNELVSELGPDNVEPRKESFINMYEEEIEPLNLR